MISEENHTPKLDKVSFLIWALGTLVGNTWRLSFQSSDNLNPVKNMGKGNIYTLWHSNILSLAFIFRNTKTQALISNSNDGKRAAAIAAMWKYGIIYGSSSNNGFSAFRQCLRSIKKGHNVVITPDGPKGPKEVVKAGIAQLTAMTAAPVIPLSVHPKHFWRLKSWDRMLIPKPFSHVKVIKGDLFFPNDFIHADDGVELVRSQIEERLHAITMA